MGKASRAIKAMRLEAVRGMLLEGRDSTDVVRDVSASFRIGERQAWNYVSEAQEQIRAVVEVDRAYRLAEHIAVRRDIRQRAKRAGDLRGELEAARDEAKLFGLYPADQVEHATKDNKEILIKVLYDSGTDRKPSETT